MSDKTKIDEAREAMRKIQLPVKIHSTGSQLGIKDASGRSRQNVERFWKLLRRHYI